MYVEVCCVIVISLRSFLLYSCVVHNRKCISEDPPGGRLGRQEACQEARLEAVGGARRPECSFGENAGFAQAAGEGGGSQSYKAAKHHCITFV